MTTAADRPKREFRGMQRRYWTYVFGALWLASLTGCRCCCFFESYNDLIDDLNDHRMLFDRWYHPRLDISRAGKPDWCGPINSRLAPCRCEDQECYDRFNEVWQYPPRYPHVHPSAFYPNQNNFVSPLSEPIEDTGPRITPPKSSTEPIPPQPDSSLNAPEE